MAGNCVREKTKSYQMIPDYLQSLMFNWGHMWQAIVNMRSVCCSQWHQMIQEFLQASTFELNKCHGETSTLENHATPLTVLNILWMQQFLHPVMLRVINSTCDGRVGVEVRKLSHGKRFFKSSCLRKSTYVLRCSTGHMPGSCAREKTIHRHLPF